MLSSQTRNLIKQYYAPQRKKLFHIVFLGIIVASAQPVCVKMSEKMVNILTKTPQSPELMHCALFVVLLFFVSGICRYFYMIKRKYLTETTVCGLREQLVSRFLSTPYDKLVQKKSGEMISSLQYDLQQVSQGLETFYDLIKEPIALLGLLSVAFYCHWKLALFTLIFAPIIAWLISHTGKKVKAYAKKNIHETGDIMGQTQEILLGSLVIKSFQLEPTLKKKFQKSQSQYLSNFLKSIQAQEFNSPFVEIIGSLIMSTVAIYGAQQIGIGTLDSGKLVAFIISIGLAQMPLKKMNNALVKIKNMDAALEKIYTLLDGKGEIQKKSQQQKCSTTDFSSELLIKSVHYKVGSHHILKGIDLSVSIGQSIALVGSSGSGKSTLVKLACGLIQPTQGSVLIDGKKLYESDNPFSYFSYVSQETFLFNDTIYENIRYGNETATEEEIQKAIKASYCDEFIERLPQGVHTMVGDRGSRLSGGEKQRVSIARALLRNAPIILLDEATSQLDPVSEQYVQKALILLLHNKTSLVVAHRLHTIQQCDKIIVMSEGSILESGTHSELLNQKQGAYRQLNHSI